MPAQEAADGRVERGHPDRMQSHAAGDVPEVVIEPVNNPDGHRILESADACGSGAAAEIPQQGLLHPRQVYLDPLLQDNERTGARCVGEVGLKCWSALLLAADRRMKNRTASH